LCYPSAGFRNGQTLVFNAFKRLASGVSASEKTDLFAGTASRFYRLSHICL
jgi:predicted TIM-barrel fold metal-dependent hydrolase